MRKRVRGVDGSASTKDLARRKIAIRVLLNHIVIIVNAVS